MHVDRYEKNFLIITIIMVVIFFLSVTIGASAAGIRLPDKELRVDPKTVADEGPFSGDAAERIHELAPGKYEVYMLAQAWKFSPGTTSQGEPEIRVPVGSSVTFYVTSKDIQHGFKMMNTNIAFMVLPGQVSKLTATFDDPGTYDIVCNEFCGSAHHIMFAQVIVE